MNDRVDPLDGLVEGVFLDVSASILFPVELSHKAPHITPATKQNGCHLDTRLDSPQDL